MEALLLIDIQEGLDELEYYGGSRNNPDAEKNAARILEQFRKNGYPIIHVKNNSQNIESPLHPSRPGNQIKQVVRPLDTEFVIEKWTNSAFVYTDLADHLDQHSIVGLVIVGLTTEHCISATARSASDLGFKVTVVSDATAAFNKSIDGQDFDADTVHKVALANLSEEFAEIDHTDSVLARLL